MPSTQVLPSWNDGASKSTIVEFVERTVNDVPVEQRVAVFDADGTLWCEKPAPIELILILERLAQMAAADEGLRGRQPWKAAYEKDMRWFSEVITQHYAGDDSQLKPLMAGITASFADMSVEDFEDKASEFLAGAKHPTLGRELRDTTYRPMVELLEYLADNGFTSYIVSGSGADFMRPVSQDLFGIPPERVLGSATALAWSPGPDGGAIVRRPSLALLDDGPQKPLQIWGHVGRRPLLAAGNSNGDLPMLEFAHRSDGTTLKLLIDHDDSDREFAYASGAEKALSEAAARGWTVVSMKNDFVNVFAP